MPVALRALDRGGTLAVAGIWLSDIPRLDYAAELFQERRLRSVTANTRADGEEFLRLADRLGIRADDGPVPVRGGRRARSPTSRAVASAARPSCTWRSPPPTHDFGSNQGVDSIVLYACSTVGSASTRKSRGTPWSSTRSASK